jgi:hypothetical protein
MHRPELPQGGDRADLLADHLDRTPVGHLIDG